MKKMFRAVAILLPIIMIIAMFSACHKPSDEKRYDEYGNVIVRIAVAQNGVDKMVTELIRGFQAQGNNVTFEIEQIVGDYTTKLITQVAAGTAPDIIWVSDEQTRLLAEKGVLVNLKDHYAANNFDESDLYESMLYCGAHEGGQYMMPRDYNHIVTYYNKALFKEAGVEEPKDGWTWDEFLETAYKLTQKSGDVYTRRACEAYLTWGATAPIIMMGLGATFTENFPTAEVAIFDSPETVAALTEIKKLVDDGIFVNDYMNDIGDFTSGKVAMCFQTRSVLSGYTDILGVENVGVVTFPVLPEQHIVGCGTSGLSVISSSKCKEEAVKFVLYSASQEGQKLFSTTGDCVPVLKSLANDDTWRNSVPGIPAEPFIDSPECDMLQPALLIPDYTTSIRFNDCWINALSGLLTNIMDPEEAAEFGQEQLELAIKRK